jgi:hypothetical protein
MFLSIFGIAAEFSDPGGSINRKIQRKLSVKFAAVFVKLDTPQRRSGTAGDLFGLVYVKSNNRC